MATVNLDRIQSWIDQGRLNPSLPITVKELHTSGCINRPIDGVKILGDGGDSLKQPIHIVASRASASAINAIEALGGSVTTRYYTASSIRRILAGETHSFISEQWDLKSGSQGLLEAAAAAYRAAQGSETAQASGEGVQAQAVDVDVLEVATGKYRLPDPTKRRDIEYYRDPAHRGYLSHLLKGSEGPSLFFRSSEERKSAAGVTKKKVLPENRLW